MAKGAREKIKLESTAGTGHFYTTTKNKKRRRTNFSFRSSIQLHASMWRTRKRS